ncbi:hypothetical protein BHE74_00028246 [Ensete ventricosum]|nr:hypothetical protein GW17_00045868 [Ensete ventricosum]RWW64506.1 hypothetical protein BHE74_00028246 [Ensete ventricosum]
MVGQWLMRSCCFDVVEHRGRRSWWWYAASEREVLCMGFSELRILGVLYTSCINQSFSYGDRITKNGPDKHMKQHIRTSSNTAKTNKRANPSAAHPKVKYWATTCTEENNWYQAKALLRIRYIV